MSHNIEQDQGDGQATRPSKATKGRVGKLFQRSFQRLRSVIGRAKHRQGVADATADGGRLSIATVYRPPDNEQPGALPRAHHWLQCQEQDPFDADELLDSRNAVLERHAGRQFPQQHPVFGEQDNQISRRQRRRFNFVGPFERLKQTVSSLLSNWAAKMRYKKRRRHRTADVSQTAGNIATVGGDQQPNIVDDLPLATVHDLASSFKMSLASNQRQQQQQHQRLYSMAQRLVAEPGGSTSGSSGGGLPSGQSENASRRSSKVSFSFQNQQQQLQSHHNHNHNHNPNHRASLSSAMSSLSSCGSSSAAVKADQMSQQAALVAATSVTAGSGVSSGELAQLSESLNETLEGANELTNEDDDGQEEPVILFKPKLPRSKVINFSQLVSEDFERYNLNHDIVDASSGHSNNNNNSASLANASSSMSSQRNGLRQQQQQPADNDDQVSISSIESSIDDYNPNTTGGGGGNLQQVRSTTSSVSSLQLSASVSLASTSSGCSELAQQAGHIRRAHSTKSHRFSRRLSERGTRARTRNNSIALVAAWQQQQHVLYANCSPKLHRNHNNNNNLDQQQHLHFGNQQYTLSSGAVAADYNQSVQHQYQHQHQLQRREQHRREQELQMSQQEQFVAENCAQQQLDQARYRDQFSHQLTMTSCAGQQRQQSRRISNSSSSNSTTWIPGTGGGEQQIQHFRAVHNYPSYNNDAFSQEIEAYYANIPKGYDNNNTNNIEEATRFAYRCRQNGSFNEGPMQSRQRPPPFNQVPRSTTYHNFGAASSLHGNIMLPDSCSDISEFHSQNIIPPSQQTMQDASLWAAASSGQFATAYSNNQIHQQNNNHRQQQQQQQHYKLAAKRMSVPSISELQHVQQQPRCQAKAARQPPPPVLMVNNLEVPEKTPPPKYKTFGPSQHLFERIILQAGTSELLRSLTDFFMIRCRKCRSADGSGAIFDHNDPVLWMEEVDRVLTVQGWQELTFINPANIVFLYMLLRELIVNENQIKNELELQRLVMSALYLAYAYMGNEISYPLNPFLCEQDTHEHFYDRSLTIATKLSANMLRLNADSTYFAEMFFELKNYRSQAEAVARYHEQAQKLIQIHQQQQLAKFSPTATSEAIQEQQQQQLQNGKQLATSQPTRGNSKTKVHQMTANNFMISPNVAKVPSGGFGQDSVTSRSSTSANFDDGSVKENIIIAKRHHEPNGLQLGIDNCYNNTRDANFNFENSLMSRKIMRTSSLENGQLRKFSMPTTTTMDRQ